VNGLGYGLAGFIVGALLPAGSAVAFALPLLIILAAALAIATIARRRLRQSEPGPSSG
jgi:membrane protein implicated in regulation of membrane protease activity